MHVPSMQASALQGMLVEALGILSASLVGEDVSFIGTAQYALRQLLATPAGAAALEQVPPLQRAQLAVFCGGRVAAAPEQEPAASRRVHCLHSIPALKSQQVSHHKEVVRWASATTCMG